MRGFEITRTPGTWGMNLGELMGALMPETPSNELTFGFGEPVSLTSYRGYYEDLAIIFASYTEPHHTVKTLLVKLREAIGKEFTGYKGGTYVMDEHTRLWVVANASETSECGIAGVYSPEPGKTVIDTMWIEG